MTDTSSGFGVLAPEPVPQWARRVGLVSDARGERRLAAMRLEVLAGGALPQGSAEDVALTAQWAAFICWVDDHIDRGGLALSVKAVEEFLAPLRHVLDAGGSGSGGVSVYAGVLAGLWERTAAGMPDDWRTRFTAEYADFLDATVQEVALRRAGIRLSVARYVRLRRRTITLLPMLNVLERTGHTVLVEVPAVAVRVRELRWAVADVAGWANDLASGADDEVAGQDNLVAAIARESACSPAEARARVMAMIEDRRAGFRATAAELRSACGSLAQGSELCRYVDLVETFMSATLEWLARTGRFALDTAPAGPFPMPTP
ncbi:terpene synthase family protein [Streptomyces lateritius]|uniref:terpene synthase family protein n=1 Tax=Streptomyces lateritius TaxID=67313 RepID=UPI0016786487|nr:terpene synthase family protein [Streptomyces lateritius]GGU14364.1 hypothetical protein GCM10010272_69250 [Streptomyces lateritius]